MNRKFFVAVKAIMFFNRKFLLVKRSDKARDEHQYWELPGGRLEFGETPEEALARELMEETSLCVNIINPLQTWNFFRGDDIQIVGITFLCKADSDNVQLSGEHDAYAWITFDELDQYRMVPSVLDELKRIDTDDVFENLSK